MIVAACGYGLIPLPATMSSPCRFLQQCHRRAQGTAHRRAPQHSTKRCARRAHRHSQRAPCMAQSTASVGGGGELSTCTRTRTCTRTCTRPAVVVHQRGRLATSARHAKLRSLRSLPMRRTVAHCTVRVSTSIRCRSACRRGKLRHLSRALTAAGTARDRCTSTERCRAVGRCTERVAHCPAQETAADGVLEKVRHSSRMLTTAGTAHDRCASMEQCRAVGRCTVRVAHCPAQGCAACRCRTVRLASRAPSTASRHISQPWARREEVPCRSPVHEKSGARCSRA